MDDDLEIAIQEIDDDVEILVEEEDQEAIYEPIVKPLVTKRFAHFVNNDTIPRTTFDYKFLFKLMEHHHAIRNVAIVGNLLSGKTTFVDCLIEQTHCDFQADTDKPIKFTDNLYTEQERGISMKSAPISIVCQNLKGKSHLLNIMDTPGHVNFSDEVTAAFRLCNGAIIVVDAADGVLMQTERLITHALRSKLSITLCINKIDRLIFELRLPPNNAYHKLERIIDEVNSIIALEDKSKLVSPILGNVCFASSQYSVCFTLKSFAKLYLERSDCKSINYCDLAKKLWGSSYRTTVDGVSKFVRKPPDHGDDEERRAKRSFVEFILDPMYKLFRMAIEEPNGQFLELAENYGIILTKKEKTMNVKPLLRRCCTIFFGSFDSFTDMIADCIPSPKDNARDKRCHIWTGPSENCELTRSITDCDPTGPLVVQITKQYPSQDASTFFAFGLVLSGTIRQGSDVKVLGESFSSCDDEDSRIMPVRRLWLSQTRYHVPVSSVPAGNWVLIEGVDEPIVKTATLIDSEYNDEIYTFRPLKFNTKAVIKIAVEPVNPSELPRMLDSLRKCNKSYPLLQTKVEESGEHVMIGTGELYLDSVMHDLRHVYSEMDIRVSDPVVSFSETIVNFSKEKCTGETPNGRNRFTMMAEPIDRGLDIDLEEKMVSLESNQRYIDDFFTKGYNWDKLTCRSIWAFGPETSSTNVLLNDTISGEVDEQLLNEIKAPIVQAFQWTTREGPLCEEPIRGVKFKLLHADIAEEPAHRGGGQIIPTARKVAFLSFLKGEPRIMEPYVFIEIIAPLEVVECRFGSGSSDKKKTLLEELIEDRRRGKIVKRKEQLSGSSLYRVNAIMPAIDSFGFETDLRIRTTGQAFCMQVFHDWRAAPGDPLDKTVDRYLVPLEPQETRHLAREFLLKTRRRKGLSEDVHIQKFMDLNQ